MSAGVDQRISSGATTSVELRGLEKTYRSPAGPVRAVRGVDIAVHVGETVALLGPNGAGKSTTIDMLLGLQSPTPVRSRSWEGRPSGRFSRAGSGSCSRPAESCAS